MVLAKSAEAIEKKRVEFCGSAKSARERKRVRRGLKRKGIGRRRVGTSAVLNVRTWRRKRADPYTLRHGKNGVEVIERKADMWFPLCR